MRFWVTGVSGQLGHDIAEELLAGGFETVGIGRSASCGSLREDGLFTYRSLREDGLFTYRSLDLTDKPSVNALMAELRPDIVIHCAGWTAVDAAEAPAVLDEVRAANITCTENLAEACSRVSARMLFFSTDYVFNGQGTEPWRADSEPGDPLGIYGATKLEAEKCLARALKEHFIVRISWLFGVNGHNFIDTMLRASQTHDEVRVVSDQIGTPSYTRDIAASSVELALSCHYGTYHMTCSELTPEKALEKGTIAGYISWYDLCCAVYKRCGITTKVIPVTTEEYGLSTVARPKNSRLDKSSLAAAGLAPLPDWYDAMERYLKECGRI